MSAIYSVKRRHTAALGAALLTACALAGLPARADGDLEREQLARIANELQVVQQMVEQARLAAQASPSSAVQFRYDWLQRDLQMMRQGIEQHIDAPRQPRPVPPLRGDYRQ